MLGICETGRAALNSTNLLAEVTDSILRLSSRTMSTQSTIDNLDFMAEHMTIEYKEVEGSSTSHLSDKAMIRSEVPNLFDLREILIEEPKHEVELKHIKKVVANTVGRLLGDQFDQVKHEFFSSMLIIV